tara:strand:- start:88 stop:495 length:408 start_codon:yes stop_codon:yes gene_type:complete
MASVQDYINIEPIDLDKNVAIGVVFPFSANAVFHSSYTTQDQAKSNLINVLLTEPGERVYEPTFGVGLKSQLFEQNVDKETLKSRINDQINFYVPEIELVDTTIDLLPDNHTLYIKLTYRFVLDNTMDSIQLNFK